MPNFLEKIYLPPILRVSTEVTSRQKSCTVFCPSGTRIFGYNNILSKVVGTYVYGWLIFMYRSYAGRFLAMGVPASRNLTQNLINDLQTQTNRL